MDYAVLYMVTRNGRTCWEFRNQFFHHQPDGYQRTFPLSKIFMSPEARAQCVLPGMRFADQWKLLALPYSISAHQEGDERHDREERIRAYVNRRIAA